MFFINRNPAPWLYTMVFYLAELLDGLVGLLTLGVIKTRLPLIAARHQAKAAILNMKRKREHECAHTSTHQDR